MVCVDEPTSVSTSAYPRGASSSVGRGDSADRYKKGKRSARSRISKRYVPGLGIAPSSCGLELPRSPVVRFDGHLGPRGSVNLRAGLQALAVAFCLACVGVAYHDMFSIGGAAVIAMYATVIPLRLQSLVTSWSFARFVLRAVARVAGLAGTIYVLSSVINSGFPIAAAFSSLILVGVFALGTIVALYAVGRKALEMVPRLTTTFRRGSALLRAQLGLVFQVVPSRV